ncbi:MAG: tetratricopeptide repeat protein, partial [Chitinophagales bacterium]
EEKIALKKQYTDNAEAWYYYNKGRFLWDNRTTSSFDSAKVYYEKATTLDPKYALAYTGLADLYVFNQKGLTQKEAVPIARDFANKALALDSTLVPAITTLGFVQSAFEYDWKKAKLTLEKAISMDPKYTYAHIYYGNVLILTRENMDAAIEQHKIALSIEPLSVSVNWILGRTYFNAGKLDLAEEQFRKTLKLFPKAGYLSRWTLSWLLLSQKRYAEAIELIKQISKNTAENQGTMLTYAYAAMGDSIRAKKELAKTIAENSYVSPYFLARDYVSLKDYNKAMDYLEIAYENRDIMMYGVNVDRVMNPIRNDPRFIELMKKMNFEHISVIE